MSEESSDEGEYEITVTGISSGEKRALMEAVSNTSSEFPVRTTLDISQVNEENIEELLDGLMSVEVAMREHGMYDEAKSASRMYDKVKKVARSEGIIQYE